MPDEAKRGRRIRDKQRMKIKAVRVYAVRGMANPNNVKSADHITNCSGPCCGNPRKWFGERTRQELKHEEAWREDA